MKVLVNKDTINSNNSSITEYIDSYDLDVGSVNGIINEIASVWEGSDHDNFALKMENFMTELNSFLESLNKYNEFINGYTSAVTTLDDYYGNKSITLN